MDEVFTPGLIFISHASLDKEAVGDVIRKIPRSHLFYDTNTILTIPTRSTRVAIQQTNWTTLLRASVFAMFVSPNTPRSVWVEDESGVAYVQKVKRNHIAILAVPIKGATYRDAPEWMQKYLAVPDAYSHSDIARLLKYLYEDVLRNQGIIASLTIRWPRRSVQQDYCSEPERDQPRRAFQLTSSSLRAFLIWVGSV